MIDKESTRFLNRPLPKGPRDIETRLYFTAQGDTDFSSYAYPVRDIDDDQMERHPKDWRVNDYRRPQGSEVPLPHFRRPQGREGLTQDPRETPGDRKTRERMDHELSCAAEDLEDDLAPAMVATPSCDGFTAQPHRQKYDFPIFPAAVARPVPRKETEEQPKARAAREAEWKKLLDKGVWRHCTVREWSGVAREARLSNAKVHMGRLFGICVEKNA